MKEMIMHRHVGPKVIESLVAPENNNYVIPTKPAKGFWTVDFQKRGMIEELKDIGIDGYHTILKERHGLKILDISNPRDLWDILVKMRFIPKSREVPDPYLINMDLILILTQNSEEIWETISQLYNAVRMNYRPKTHGWIYRMGWDIPSTVWFRPQDDLQIISSSKPSYS